MLVTVVATGGIVMLFKICEMITETNFAKKGGRGHQPGHRVDAPGRATEATEPSSRRRTSCGSRKADLTPKAGLPKRNPVGVPTSL